MRRTNKKDAVLGVVLLISVVLGIVKADANDADVDQDYSISLSDMLEGKAGVEMLRERRTSSATSPDAKWTLGLGVLSNMQQYFDNLKSNLDGLEALPKDERDALLGKALVMAEPYYWTPVRSQSTLRGICGGKPCWQSFSRYTRFPHVYRLTRAHEANIVSHPEQDKTFRPRATAAYLHALRNHRPSHKLRNFVDDSDITNYRGANSYDPNLLWTGLGKRR